MLPFRLPYAAVTRSPARCLTRAFSATHAFLEKPLPPRMVIPETDLIESFLKGSGPGGQKINKTSSAVQLKHLPTGIVVKSQETRSREQNRRTARRILGEKLEEMKKGPLARTALKAAKERKKKASASKKSKRKYRKLGEGKEGQEGGMEEQSDDVKAGEGEDVAARDITDTSSEPEPGRRDRTPSTA